MWRTQDNFDFDLTDPNLYTYPATLRYNSLYDKTLRGYFANPRVHKHLLRHGLVTRDGRVPCQLREFNHFRAYLHRHNIRIIQTNHVRTLGLNWGGWDPTGSQIRHLLSEFCV